MRQRQFRDQRLGQTVCISGDLLFRRHSCSEEVDRSGSPGEEERIGCRGKSYGCTGPGAVRGKATVAPHWKDACRLFFPKCKIKSCLSAFFISNWPPLWLAALCLCNIDRARVKECILNTGHMPNPQQTMRSQNPGEMTTMGYFLLQSDISLVVDLVRHAPAGKCNVGGSNSMAISAAHSKMLKPLRCSTHFTSLQILIDIF